MDSSCNHNELLILKMDSKVEQPIYDSVDNVVSPGSCGIYYKSMSPDTLLDIREEGGYQQTADTCRFLGVNDSHFKQKSLRVLNLKSLKIAVCVLCALTLLSMTVAIVGVALASASWNKDYVNPSLEQRVTELSNAFHREVSALRKQSDGLEQRLIQVSQVYENCSFEVANCSINFPLLAIKPSCKTLPVLSINKKVSTSS